MDFYKDKIIWITGANKGIGKALSNILIDYLPDSKFILSSSSSETLKPMVENHNSNSNIYFFPFDLNEPSIIRKVHKKIESTIGNIDI